MGELLALELPMITNGGVVMSPKTSPRPEQEVVVQHLDDDAYRAALGSTDILEA